MVVELQPRRFADRNGVARSNRPDLGCHNLQDHRSAGWPRAGQPDCCIQSRWLARRDDFHGSHWTHLGRAGGKEVAQLGVGNFEAFSPDWKRLVEVEFAQARVRDAATLREIAVLAGHSHEISSAAFSPDGTRIVTASEDRTSRVWDAATGRELGVLRGHRGIVRFAAFSRDGTRIVTTSDDKTARIWDAATAKEVGTLRGHRESVRSAAFDPVRPRVVTASEDGTARIWNVDLQFRPLQDVIAQACARLSRLSQMTRDEMRLAGYHDSEPLADVCP